MIYVLATSELNDGCKEKFLEVLKANVPNVLAEEGCIMYVPNVDFASGLSAQKEVRENTVTIIEGWESMDHLMKHLQSAHMADFRTKVNGMRKSSTLNVVTPA
ncbi:MAG: putative quinol monooxygenase [Victivallales bacterium]|jgi:antibiotic biosynthesis monooxygenase